MYHIIVNPSSKSGLGRKKWNELKKLLLKEMVTYNVQFTSGHMSAYKCIRQLTSKDFPKPLHLIILGGDGTVNEVLNGIQDFDTTILTYLPCGSSNDFARDMKLTDRPEEMLKHLLTTKTVTNMDYGKVRFKGGKRKFAVSCGMGYDAAVCEQSLDSPLKKVLNFFRLGKLTYGITALKQLLTLKPVSSDIYIDGDSTPRHFDNMLFCVAMNRKYEGGGFMFAPEADATDGYLDLCVAYNIKRWQVPYILPLCLKGKHVGIKGVELIRAKEYKIKTSAPLPIHTDGEICGHFDTVHISVEAGALKYV